MSRPGEPGGSAQARDDLGAGASPLSPVRAALINEATQRAGEILAAATQEADALLVAARRQAEHTLSQARARGELDGQAAAAARHAAAQRAARQAVLAAQREAYEQLRRQVQDAVGALREDRVYPHLLAELEKLARRTARRAAGGSVAITHHPDGGAVAKGSGTLVDCSLPQLADRAVDALGAEVNGLWSG